MVHDDCERKIKEEITVTKLQYCHVILAHWYFLERFDGITKIARTSLHQSRKGPRKERRAVLSVASVSWDHQKTVKMFLQLSCLLRHTLCHVHQSKHSLRHLFGALMIVTGTSHTIHSQNNIAPPRNDWTSWFGIWQYFRSL
jgi:hypothetical protein